jgi:hypothetical protein
VRRGRKNEEKKLMKEMLEDQTDEKDELMLEDMFFNQNGSEFIERKVES